MMPEPSFAGQPHGYWMNDVSSWKYDSSHPLHLPSAYGIGVEGRDAVKDQELMDMILKHLFDQEQMARYRSKMAELGMGSTPTPTPFPPTPTPPSDIDRGLVKINQAPETAEERYRRLMEE